MVKKHRLIKGICDKLRGITAINFQMKIKEVLKIYYETKNKTFEMPRPQGGVKKNDGYVRKIIFIIKYFHLFKKKII